MRFPESAQAAATLRSSSLRSTRARPVTLALAAFLDLVYPRDCIVCKAPHSGTESSCFCDSCLNAMPRIGDEQCPRCGDALGPFARGRKACGSCRDRTGLVFRGAVAVCHYESAARELVHRFKYSGDLRAVNWMGRELAGKLRRMDWLNKVNAIVPVPLHWRRKVLRHFNQSELIARRVARECGKPLLGSVLHRTRKTVSQSILNPRQREENVRGAFAVIRKKRIADRVILLVDDVMTTCATAAECARSLVRAGARAVHVAVFAR